MQERRRHGRTTETPRPGAERPGRAKQRAFCIAALEEGDDLSELQELLRTAGVAVVGQIVQHREKPHPNTYLGPGKLEEVKAAAKAADANVIVCDDELSPRQERNIEKELEMPVLDRTSLILDVFAGHAHSADGKLQVELAQLEYNMARMRGLWTHLDRLGVGGVGTRGPGETQIETDRRLARNRISALKRTLAQVKGSRDVMRAERERSGLPEIALAGYTNAGKSTLLNALTGSDVGVQDRLFHTLDPTTRTMRLEGRPFLVTDTVGFIRKLPRQLVDAFGATLEETRLAELILHVVDASAEEDELLEMLAAVDTVLEEIGAGENPRLLVLNKADLIDAGSPRGAAAPAPGCRPDLRRGGHRARPAARADRGRVRAPDAADRAADALCRGRSSRRAARHRRRPRAHRHARRRPRQGARACADRRALLALRGQRRRVGVKLPVRRVDPAAVLPVRAHADDAGLDLCSVEALTIDPGRRAQVRTGLAVEIPSGYAGLVLPRSGLAARHGISLVNAPGLIDAGYRGELHVLLLNTDREVAFEIAAGDRIAQLVVVAVTLPEPVEAHELTEAVRGAGGFGSTGR